MTRTWQRTLGAIPAPEGYQFRVWAPNAQQVTLELQRTQQTSQPRSIPMTRDLRGYYQVTVADVTPGCRYGFRLDGGDVRPDPASQCQPDGVHGLSEVLDPQFEWHDLHWGGIAQPDFIIYELHVGAFSEAGTFEGIIPYLDELRDLGITAIELMPIAQFPGKRNWGYDGVDLFAAQNSYGGPQGLKRLVDACHQRGLAVLLDAVYNHFGPEGNYWREFGPYFNEKNHTTWGAAINFDSAASDEVRHFFIENALCWINDFHIDGLRLDATDAYIDFSAYTFLEELAESVHQLGRSQHRRVYLMAENDRNDARLTRPADQGGYGVDAQWIDDFHHALHTVLTYEKTSYYQDFGELQQLAKAMREGFAYTGDYSAFRQHRRGTSSRDIPAWRFVAAAQNHDQVGNRMLGERFTHLITFEGQKVAAGVLLLSPFIPLLFMGEEYGEDAPFQYFTDHGDPALVEAVRAGRRQDFAAFHAEGDAPDPQSEISFQKSRLNHALKRDGQHRVLYDFYKALIQLRAELPARDSLNQDHAEVFSHEKARWIYVRHWDRTREMILVFSFGQNSDTLRLPASSGQWRKRFDSTESCWNADAVADNATVRDEFNPALVSDGELSLTLNGLSFVVYEKESVTS